LAPLNHELCNERTSKGHSVLYVFLFNGAFRTAWRMTSGKGHERK